MVLQGDHRSSSGLPASGHRHSHQYFSKVRNKLDEVYRPHHNNPWSETPRILPPTHLRGSPVHGHKRPRPPREPARPETDPLPPPVRHDSKEPELQVHLHLPEPERHRRLLLPLHQADGRAEHHLRRVFRHLHERAGRLRGLLRPRPVLVRAQARSQRPVPVLRAAAGRHQRAAAGDRAVPRGELPRGTLQRQRAAGEGSAADQLPEHEEVPDEGGPEQAERVRAGIERHRLAVPRPWAAVRGEVPEVLQEGYRRRLEEPSVAGTEPSHGLAHPGEVRGHRDHRYVQR